MGTIILYCVFGALAVFIIYMLVVTNAMGTERLKVPQFLMSSLTYSEEATTKINLLIDKYEAGLLSVTKNDKTLEFKDESGNFAGVIWIANKYYSYGNLHRYGSTNNNQWACNKPDIKTFKRIVKLEQTLDKPSQASAASAKPKTKGEEVILD